MKLRCPNCDELVDEMQPQLDASGYEKCLPCGCVVEVQRVFRVREYAVAAMAHRAASGESARRRQPRAASRSRASDTAR
jgi:hypothetical protein